MADLSEMWKGIRDILVADSTLTAMLSDSSAVYEPEPPDDVDFPMLTIMQTDDGPVTECTGYGEFAAQLQIDVWSTSPRTNEQIKSRLDELLEIPKIRATAITTTNYNVTNVSRSSANFVGTVEIEKDGKLIRHLATEWDVKIRKTT